MLALQRTLGNRAVGQVLARKTTAAGPTIKIGKFSIKVSGGNIDAWAAGEVPEALEVTSEKGKHSAELERMSKEKTRIDSLTLTVAPPNKSNEQLDLGSLVIEITNGRVKNYQLNEKTESWKIVDFDGVHRKKTTRKIS